MQKVNDAKQLIAGASSLLHSFSHRGENTPEGLGKEHFVENWEEGKDVWMFSGCRDDQTSADTFVDSTATGAMSWAFIGTMMENPHQTYVQVLQNTRRKLAGKYKQVPQLSVSIFGRSFVWVKLTSNPMQTYRCQCGGKYRLTSFHTLRTWSPILIGQYDLNVPVNFWSSFRTIGSFFHDPCYVFSLQWLYTPVVKL